MFCQPCAQTIFHALVEGDMPYVGTKNDYRDFPVETVKKFVKDQLLSSSDRWKDKYDIAERDLFKAIDLTGTNHYFTLSYQDLGALLSFDAREVHRLTKAGKLAVNNTDTDYEYHHLVELKRGNNKEQRIYAGLRRLIKLQKNTIIFGKRCM